LDWKTTIEFSPFAEHNLQFPQLQNVNLLETLIAASRELLERQREKLTDQPTANGHQQQQQFEFSSPDSAVASTSEEGWENQQQQQLLSITGVENNMEEEEGEEERSEGGIDGVADQQQQREEEEEQEEKINGTAADHSAHQQRQDRVSQTGLKIPGLKVYLNLQMLTY